MAAALGFPVHPHMLRHACGFALANKDHHTRALQAYLGHRVAVTDMAGSDTGRQAII